MRSPPQASHKMLRVWMRTACEGLWWTGLVRRPFVTFRTWRWASVQVMWPKLLRTFGCPGLRPKYPFTLQGLFSLGEWHGFAWRGGAGSGMDGTWETYASVFPSECLQLLKGVCDPWKNPPWYQAIQTGHPGMVCCCLVAKLCLTLCNPTNYSLPGFSVHGILWARILEWVAISSSRDLEEVSFRDQGSSPHLLPWQADSLLLSHRGSPMYIYY